MNRSATRTRDRRADGLPQTGFQVREPPADGPTGNIDLAFRGSSQGVGGSRHVRCGQALDETEWGLLAGIGVVELRCYRFADLSGACLFGFRRLTIDDTV